MPNTDPVAVRISNEVIRPLCDNVAGLTLRLAGVLKQGQVQDFATHFPADNELIADGSDVDGRKPITNSQVLSIIGATAQFVTYMNTPLAGFPTNPNTGQPYTPLELALIAAVNPR